MKSIQVIFFLLSCALLSSCATITSGNQQSVAVDTGKVTGAKCALSNDSGTWYVNQTPGATIVKRSGSDLTIACEKGVMRGAASTPSSAKAAAFGNIIAGGIIGAAVDMGSGSAYDYPSIINVPMQGTSK